MKFYAKKNTDGSVARLQITNQGENPPIDCIEVSEQEFQTLTQTQSLDDLKLTALDYIDKVAGEARLRFITDVPGQPQTYVMKIQDALDFKANRYGDLASYPMMQAEVDATGRPAEQVCEELLATYAQWKQLSAIIERERRSGKIGVGAALDAPTITSERDSALNSLKSIGI